MTIYGKYCDQPMANPVMSVSIGATDSPYNVPFFAEQIFVDPTAAAVEVKLLTCVPNGILPTSTGRIGRTVTITDVTGKARTHNITITPNGTEKIGGAANYVIDKDYGSVTLRQNAAGWFVVATENEALPVYFTGQTTSAILMAVDPVGGTSPPVGTIIHNQAEYDALGYDLLYPQDAVDILPIGIGHPITVELSDGTYPAKDGNLGFPGYAAALAWRPFISTADVPYDLTNPYYARSLIYFKGLNKTVIASKSGTCVGRGGFTGVTPAGMTPDEYKGKMLVITSGVNAGVALPIRANAADTVLTAPVYMDSGACTFDIYEPSAVWLSSIDGLNPSGVGLYLGDSGVQWAFENVKFGTAALPMDYSNNSGSQTIINGCMFTGLYVYSAFINTNSKGYTNLYYSLLDVAAGGHSAVLVAGAEATMYIMGCMFDGSPSSWYMEVSERSEMLFCYNTLEVPAGFAGACYLISGGIVHLYGENYLFGNGDCTGWQMTDNYYVGPSQLIGYYCWVATCDTVLALSSIPSIRIATHWTFIHVGEDNDYHLRVTACKNVTVTSLSFGDSTGKRLLVNGLNPDTSSGDLNTAFSVYGMLTSTSVATDPDTGRSLGYGIVVFVAAVDATAAMNALNGSTLGGSIIAVSAPPHNHGVIADMVIDGVEYHVDALVLNNSYYTGTEISGQYGSHVMLGV